jgi:glycosyltransferase involved in cell wall biosynthesis
MINDGSTDKSGEIGEKYANLKENFIYFAVENGGPAKARNMGINTANGKYITFVDADDWVEPDYLQNFITASNTSNNQLIAQYFTLEYADGTQGKWTKENVILAAGCGNLFDREIIIKNALKLDETMKLGEDTMFNLEYMKYAEGIQKMDSFAYHYCIKKEGEISLTNSVTFDSLILFIEKLQKKHEEEYVENNIYLRDFIIKHIDNHVDSIILKLKENNKRDRLPLFSIDIVRLIVEREGNIIESFKNDLEKIRKSNAFYIGKLILKPFSFIRSWLSKL